MCSLRFYKLKTSDRADECLNKTPLLKRIFFSALGYQILSIKALIRVVPLAPRSRANRISRIVSTTGFLGAKVLMLLSISIVLLKVPGLLVSAILVSTIEIRLQSCEIV